MAVDNYANAGGMATALLIATALLKEYDEGIKQFGLYTLHDKGVDEIMFIAPWIAKIKKELVAGQVVDLLYKIQLHEHGDDLVGYIIGEMDSMPEDYWDTIVNSPGLNDYY